jgi:glyoxylase-like metal-dependent hydrolase (beta-lactamase superfamily II)
MLQFQTFVGGIFDTNSYLVKAPAGNILIDAPTGSSGWLQQLDTKPDLLLITHGHVDHVDDAARTKRLFDCKVAYHRETEPLIMDPNFFKKFGFFLEAEPVTADFFINETLEIDLQGIKFQVLYVPGHCPGSVCFYAAEHQVLFAGDTLFAGSVGRADLPGGNYDLLIKGIQKKIFALPDQTRVLSGHGPETTVGEEKRSNPYLR